MGFVCLLVLVPCEGVFYTVLRVAEGDTRTRCLGAQQSYTVTGGHEYRAWYSRLGIPREAEELAE
jgi:hypothetical protein